MTFKIKVSIIQLLLAGNGFMGRGPKPQLSLQKELENA